MKRSHPFLLLALIIVLCQCSKQNQPDSYPPVTGEQTLESRLGKPAISKAAEEDSLLSLSPIPQKFFDEVAALTRSLQETLSHTFNRLNPGLYEAYQKDLETASHLSTDEEREKYVSMMKKTYYAFLKEGWAKAGIDEDGYRKKITNLLPRDLRGLIRFDTDFLNFYFDIIRPPGSATWVPRMKDIDRWDFDDRDVPAPTQPPAPPCQLTEGKVYYPNFTTQGITIEKFLSADAAAYGQYSYGLYARANTWPVLGRGLGAADLVSSLVLPDNGCKQVRVRKTTHWQASLYAFTFYGHLTVSTAEFNTGFTAGNVTAVAPLLWFHERNASRTISENYTISKNDYRSKYGAHLAATVSSEGIFSHGSSKTSLTVPSWTLTELCCK